MEKKEQNLKEIKNLANQTSIEESSMQSSDVEYYGSCGWGSCGTGSSGGGEDYTQIQGSGFKGSPTGCGGSAATGNGPNTWEDANKAVNVMNNSFVRGRINMMWDAMTAAAKDNQGTEYACCIFYDFDRKEYIGGKFLKGTGGQVEIKDFTLLGNGFTGNAEHVRLVTIIHVHPALTYDTGNNVRVVGPSNDDYKVIKRSGCDFGIVVDYKGKEEDYFVKAQAGQVPDEYFKDKDGNEIGYMREHGTIIRSGHAYTDPRQYSIINGSGGLASGGF